MPSGSGRPLVTDEILAVAASMFRSRGYHNTRMQDIAAIFDVTHAALYYHFTSKNDILAQINLGAITTILDEARSIAALPLPPAERFLRLTRAHMTWVAENAALASSLFEHDEEMPKEKLERIRELRREYSRIQRDTYAEGVQAGELLDVDPRLATNLITGAGNWTYRWYHEGGLTPEELADVGVEILARGFLSNGHPR